MAMDGARSRTTLLVLSMAGLGFAACHRPLHAGRRAMVARAQAPSVARAAPTSSLPIHPARSWHSR